MAKTPCFIEVVIQLFLTLLLCSDYYMVKIHQEETYYDFTVFGKETPIITELFLFVVSLTIAVRLSLGPLPSLARFVYILVCYLKAFPLYSINIQCNANIILGSAKPILYSAWMQMLSQCNFKTIEFQICNSFRWSEYHFQAWDKSIYHYAFIFEDL